MYARAAHGSRTRTSEIQEPKSCASANSAKAANMHLLHYRVSMNEMQEGLAVIGSTGVAQYSSYLSPSGLDPGAAIENIILRAAPAS